MYVGLHRFVAMVRIAGGICRGIGCVVGCRCVAMEDLGVVGCRCVAMEALGVVGCRGCGHGGSRCGGM